MYTPEEIRERSAELGTSVFGGYRKESVEELLASLQEDYAALYNENTELRRKLKVVAGRLEEIRDQEENIKKTMLKAQATADEMVSDAERKSARMLSDTEERLRQRSQELSSEVLQEQARANHAKEVTARFIVELEERLNAQLLELEKIKNVEVPAEVSQAQSVSRTERRPAARPAAVQAQPQEDGDEDVKVAEPAKPEKEEPVMEVSQKVKDDITRILEDPSDQERANQELDDKLSKILAQSVGQDDRD